jgi:hypothetical protein
MRKKLISLLSRVLMTLETIAREELLLIDRLMSKE